MHLQTPLQRLGPRTRPAVLSSSRTLERHRLLLQVPVRCESFSSEVLSELPDVGVLLGVALFRREERVVGRRDGKRNGRIRRVDETSAVEGEEMGGEFVLREREEREEKKESVMIVRDGNESGGKKGKLNDERKTTRPRNSQRSPVLLLDSRPSHSRSLLPSQPKSHSSYSNHPYSLSPSPCQQQQRPLVPTLRTTPRDKLPLLDSSSPTPSSSSSCSSSPSLLLRPEDDGRPDLSRGGFRERELLLATGWRREGGGELSSRARWLEECCGR